MEPLIFTDSAAAKVWQLIQEEGNFNLKLRVYVTGGGCSGFQYGFTFDEDAKPDDIVVTKTVAPVQHDDAEDDDDDSGSSGDAAIVSLLVDPLSFQYLNQAEIDYTEGIEGEQFIIRNPNAKTTCGCGSSFTAE